MRVSMLLDILCYSIFKNRKAVAGVYTLMLGGILLTGQLQAQTVLTDSTYKSPQVFTLQQCIDYALDHQPLIKQSQLNVAITRTTNLINVSGWLPQATASASLTHYFQLPTSIVTVNGQETPEKVSVINTVIPEISLSQAIFSPSLFYAASSAHLYVKQAEQVVDSTKIGIASSVSKSFYNLLLTLRQIDVLKEDTMLFARNVNDAYHQYIGGIVDETDYEQAQITLNNARAQLKQAIENAIPQYAVLKQLMGYKPEDQFNVSYDTAQMMKDIAMDTTMQLQYEKRIEYQQLTTAKKLQQQVLLYNELSFLPTLGAYYDYNYEFENNVSSEYFGTPYPNSLVGLSLNLPLFTGLSRIEGVRRARMQRRLLDYSEEALRSEIYTEYTGALASYNGNLYNMNELQANVIMAKRVYGVVALQYRQGIVPYLNLLTAESNLINSEISYLNSVFTVLSSKIDLEKSMGLIQY